MSVFSTLLACAAPNATTPEMSPHGGHGDHPHGGGHGGGGHKRHQEHGGHDKHGNPEDLARYLDKLENPERDAWQKPDEVIAALKVKPTDVVCDIGGGPGYFALRFAAKVQHVYAVDVEPQLLSVLRERIGTAKRHNVTPVLALQDDPLIPVASCDLIVVIDTYHHFPDGVAYLQRLARSLKPGGRLVNIDFHDRETPVGPDVSHRVSREDFLAEAQKAGLALTAEETFLPYQYFVVLQPKR